MTDAPEAKQDTTKTAKPIVEITTNRGKMQIELNQEKAPATVANFITYVESGFFSNTIFHRVIDNFMIQGGAFTTDMQQKDGNKPIKNEADNGLKNVVGSIAMARTNDPHSASNQFFINLSDNSFLNHRAKTPEGWGYTVFGQLISGLDVLKQIGKVSTTSAKGHQDVPKEAVIMESVVLVKETEATPTAPITQAE